MKLREALATCSSSLLFKIARRRGLAVEATMLRGEVLDALAEELAAASRDGALWKGLDALSLSILQAIAAGAGRVHADVLPRRLAGRLAPEASKDEIQRRLDLLVERGVLYRLFESEPGRSGVVYVLPAEFAASVRVSDSWRGPRAAAVERPGSILENDIAADIFVLASKLRRQRWAAPESRSSMPGVVDLVADLDPSGPEVDGSLRSWRWRMLVALGRAQGFLAANGWPAPVDREIERTLATGDTAVRLWQAHCSLARQRPVASDSRPRGSRFPGELEAAELLLGLATGAWYAADDVVAHLVSGAAWAAAETAARRRTWRWMVGPWYWLGLLRWGRSGSHEFVQLTEMGRALLGREPWPPSRRIERCWIEEDLVLAAPAMADLATLYRAERFLQLESESMPRRYRLTHDSIARGRRLGISAHEALTLLEMLVGSELPTGWRKPLTGSFASREGEPPGRAARAD